jgi:hypothetical protein
MKHLIKQVTPILSVAGLALTAVSGHAQTFQYNTGDLILDFSEAGYADLEVDIGSLSSLNNAAQSDGGTFQINQYNVTSQLLGNFNSSASGVTFTVIGGAGVANADDYLTLKRTSPGVQNATPSDWTASKGNSILSQIGGITSGITTWSGNNAADPVANTATAALIPSSASASAQYVDSFTYHKSGLTGYTGVNIGNTLSGSSVVSDLFDYAELGGATKATYEGYFTFNTDGSLDYTTGVSAVPEPKSFGLLAGAGLLAVAFRNQCKVKRA